ncbi:MAG TPA: hypothetical protein PLJ12_09385, partial [Planctomycetota bacterium]|nr:hypothetical protein [Planctomycetota bacterium]
MSRLLTRLCFLFVAVGLSFKPLWAQEGAPKTPVVVQFLKVSDEKELKALAKTLPLYRFGEEVGVMGEVALEGQHTIGTPLEMYVPSLAKSAKIGKVLAEAPYEFDEDGKRELISRFKKNLVSIPSKNLAMVSVDGGQALRQATISDFGLFSMCADLEERRIEINELEDALKDIKQAEDPDGWARTRNQLTTKWESLVQYCEGSMLFGEMGPKLRSEYEKGTSKIRDQESGARTDEFTKAIKDAKPEKIELGADKKMEFHSFETPHLRMVYLVSEGGISDDYAKQLAQLGEESLEHFRRITIEPFKEMREEQAGDHPSIPDGIFQEYFIGPDNTQLQAKFWEEHYNRSGDDPGIFEVMATGAILSQNRDEPLFLAFAKNRPGAMPGWIVHQMGHSMAALHYNRTNERTVGYALPLIQESVAMHLCFEKLGNNSMRCTNFEKATYEKPEGTDKKKDVELWDSYKSRFYKLSLLAPTFADCAIVPLNDLNELHMAKGWLTYDYILSHDGVMGQRWIRQAQDCVTGQSSGDRTGLDRNQWRPLTKELFGISDTTDPLLHYEDT